MNPLWTAAQRLDEEGTPFVTVTMVSVRGSAPQEVGAKALVTSEGLAAGTVGGGKVEARCILRARELLAGAPVEPELVTWNLQRDIGMSCGGEATFLFEVHRRDRWRIVIFGAGHVSQALTRALLPLECQVTCVDSRPEWLERLPSGIKREHLANPADWVALARGDEYFVVMTQGHGTDLPVLEEILKRFPDAPYIGGVGSDVKALKLRKELADRGVPPATLDRFLCPIGLPLGGNQPAEIAISVIAQLLQFRDQQKN